MIIVVLVVLGLCFGSFVNALVWRVHEQAKKSKKLKAQDLSIVRGRSMCIHCHHTLVWQDLLPVASWLRLGGKCRYCHKPISWQYPLIELLTAALFVLSYAYWPTATYGAHFVAIFALWLVLLVGFVALAVYDLRWMLLPDRIVFPLIGVAAVMVLLQAVFAKDVTVVSDAFLAVLCSAGVFYALFQLSKGKWIGGGDVKLAVVLGLVVAQPMRAVLMLFIASWLGTIAGIPLLIKGKSKSAKIPFGPFLLVATLIVFLFGASLVAWYNRQFLFV